MTFSEIGLKRLEGNKAICYMYDESVNLEGIVSTHVNNFDLARHESFVAMVMEKVSAALDVSKVEDKEFVFTGIDIK